MYLDLSATSAQVTPLTVSDRHTNTFNVVSQRSQGKPMKITVVETVGETTPETLPTFKSGL